MSTSRRCWATSGSRLHSRPTRRSSACSAARARARRAWSIRWPGSPVRCAGASSSTARRSSTVSAESISRPNGDGSAIAVGDVDEVMGRLDLRPQTGRYEAGAVIDTVVAGHDTEYGLTTLRFDGGELTVPNVEALVGERVRVRIRARDVALALTRPVGLSVINVLPGTLVAIADPGGPIVEAQLRVGAASLVARITRRSRVDLRLAEGQQLYALVKAVSFDRRSVGYA